MNQQVLKNLKELPHKNSFYLDSECGNNAFAWTARLPSPRLFVPACKEGTFKDLELGTEIAFADFDEYGALVERAGLKFFIETIWNGVPTIVMDNHNHAFYFWYEALEKNLIKRGATLIHVDQHKDSRLAPESYLHKNLQSAHDFTNQVLNVGNYIMPAMGEGLIKDVLFVTGESALEEESYLQTTNKILNIDLDYFAPELEIDLEKAKKFIFNHLKTANFVTISTSPFFIDQKLALEVLDKLVED